IGYISDTVSLDLDRDLQNVNFELTQTKVVLAEIVVRPGENPAIPIIKEAIKRKDERNEKLKSYEFEAYSKGIIKTQEDISSKGNSVDLGLGINDSLKLKITGILENQSKGYFKKPDSYKEIIVARKQSSNFPSSVNLLTGGRLIQNFYEDNVSFFGRNFPGPLSKDALSYYYFNLEKRMTMDNRIVYEIYMSPVIYSDPGFQGNIFITDSTYDLIKVELQLNRAANTGGLFDTISIYQQFANYDYDIFMPSDYRLVLVANLLGLAKIGFELNTILYDYKINPDINDDFFNKAVITVLPQADKKDSIFWTKIQSIPNTKEEQEAYRRIDSIEAVPRRFWDNFSILSNRIDLIEDLSISAPLGMYHFNSIEGHALDFGIFLDNALEERLKSSLKLSYGFSDKKLKEDYSAQYLLGDYRTTKINLEAFKRLSVLFENSDDYNELTTTLLSLLSKYEFRDYFYSKGFKLNIFGDIFPVLSLDAGFINQTDNDAVNRSNFSFFAKDRAYRINPPVNEVKINALTGGFNIDFRDYIEDGFTRRRITRNDTYIIFGGDAVYSNPRLLRSGLEFKKYHFNIEGGLNTFNSANLNFLLDGNYNEGTLPYQWLYSIPGNINLASKKFTFRTLNVNEIIGENALALFLEHDFRDEIFKWLRIPGLRDWEIQLNTFFNSAISMVGNKTQNYIPFQLKELKHPFYEAGFGIGHVLSPIQIEFAWRLNYRGENNFRVSLNSFIF
ncbi:MAG: DUF5686 family protein, partial [Ignavibacteriaceae bacterium]|nr:DUF5686 family protein [Ignavibacteriaceae bacterium]